MTKTMKDTDEVTPIGLLLYAEWCRTGAANLPKYDFFKTQLCSQEFVTCHTGHSGFESHQLLSCAQVAESLAYSELAMEDEDL